MAKAYHNLAGWLRDVRAAAREPAGLELYEELVAVWLNLEAEVDERDSATDGDSPEMDGDRSDVRASDDGGARGPAPRSRGNGIAASCLDRLVDGLAGPERAAAVAELDMLRRDSLGAPKRVGQGEDKPRGRRA